MSDMSPPVPQPFVSRARYDRERNARPQAEALLEAKSRDLYAANLALARQAQILEGHVQARTTELRNAVRTAETANRAKSSFLDINMPRLDGSETLREIARLAQAAGYRCPPAIALTAAAMEDQLRALRADGFVECVTKPFKRKALAETICQLVLPARAA